MIALDLQPMFPKAKSVLVFAALIPVFFFAGCKTEQKKTSTPVVSTTSAPVAPAAPKQEPPPEFAGPNLPIKVPRIFSDNMVLQQGMSVPVWGWATDGETVTVTFGDQKVSATAKNGKWQVKLRNLRASTTPEVLTISGRTTIQFTNVLVGEVWVCSGQSNMEWPLKKAFQPEADIAAATTSFIRLFMVPNTKSDMPLDDVAKAEPPYDFQSRWLVCAPDWAAGFSAVGYYFGRDLQAARNVPVGLIQSDWGGSPAEVWMSHDVLESNPRYKTEILDPYPAVEKNYNDALAAFEKEKADALAAKKEFKKYPPFKPWKPSELYNGMIAPLIPYAMKGVIWYQGESNAPRAQQYHTLFPNLIQNWRHNWGEGDFPFLCVQLAPFKPIQPQPVDSDWAELREAQMLAAKLMPKVGMAVITDVGEERDIHPTKKEPVGHRLSLAARGIAYGEKIIHSGPFFKHAKVDGSKMVLTFDHVGSGLECRGGVCKGFAICGADRKFYWALAEIQPDNSITVWSPNVPEPVAVRYGWSDYPVVNLWNREGLPASPFRTDNFPMITDPANKKTEEKK